MKFIKLAFVITLTLPSGQSYAQQALEKKFSINGQLSGIPKDSAIVYYSAAGRYESLSVPIVDQKFTVGGNIEIPVMATVIFKNAGEVISTREMERRWLILYIEPKKMLLTGDASKVKEMKLSGSQTQLEYEELNHRLADITEAKQPVFQELSQEKDHEKQAAIREKLSSLNEKEKKIVYLFFIAHPNSYVTLDRMRFYISGMKLDSAKRIYGNFDMQLKETAAGKKITEVIKGMEAGMPGSMAANFAATDINGKPLALANFKGKYVILDFWASWCVPCRKSNPHLINLYKKYHPMGLNIIGVSDDDHTVEAWRTAVIKDGIGLWSHVLRGFDMQLRMERRSNPKDINEIFGIHSLPTKILIDPTGKIIGRFGDSNGDSNENLDKMLSSVF